MSSTQRYADYDQIAPTYDARYERNSYDGVGRALREFIGSQPGLRILEVGCGTGHWLEFLQAHGVTAAGLDLSSGMLAQARARLKSSPLIQGTADRLPCPEGGFDRMYCINALHHFPDKPAFLAEARRALDAKGQILIVGLDPHSRADQWFIYHYFPESLTIDRQRYPASGQLRNWLREAGFENGATREVEHWTYRLPAEEVLRQGRLDKTATSQLSVLTEPEYRRGMEQIWADMQQAQALGEPLFLSANLRLYGTIASAGGTTFPDTENVIDC